MAKPQTIALDGQNTHLPSIDTEFCLDSALEPTPNRLKKISAIYSESVIGQRSHFLDGLRTVNLMNSTWGITHMDQNQSGLTTGHRLTATTCPRCQSTHIETLGYGRRIGGTVGTVAGAASGAASAMGGAEVGAAVGMLVGPLGAVLGGIAGALMGGVAGAAVGGVAGSQLGRVVDENILDNFCCLSCGHAFGEQRR